MAARFTTREVLTGPIEVDMIVWDAQEVPHVVAVYCGGLVTYQTFDGKTRTLTEEAFRLLFRSH